MLDGPGPTDHPNSYFQSLNGTIDTLVLQLKTSKSETTFSNRFLIH